MLLNERQSETFFVVVVVVLFHSQTKLLHPFRIECCLLHIGGLNVLGGQFVSQTTRAGDRGALLSSLRSTNGRFPEAFQTLDEAEFTVTRSFVVRRASAGIARLVRQE